MCETWRIIVFPLILHFGGTFITCNLSPKYPGNFADNVRLYWWIEFNGIVMTN